jgi:outer membrane protein assembly factor BamA
MDEQDFTVESEATNTGGNIGVAGSVGYRNKNTFRGAEILQLRIRGGLEAIPNFTGDTLERKRLFFFNTYEIGPEFSLSFRKFPLPSFLEKNTSRYFNPLSTFNFAYNYQERPDYTRSVTNFSFNVNWTQSRNQRWIIYFPDINAVRVNLSPEFRATLESLNDPRLRYSYDPHLITSIHGSWIFNNQATSTTGNFIFLRPNLEYAFKAFNSSLAIARYVKFDVDFSYHQYVNPFNNLIYRFAFGVGFPQQSTRALPFEKSFFAGGANSVRAWSARTLGPGSYRQTLNIEQSGDIKIEANVEYRSNIFRFPNGIVLEGAAFADAGNVWTRNEDESRPGSQFDTNTALSELGIGSGVGLRFNFSFFIFRSDFAVKLRDPSLGNNRWVYPQQKFVIGDITTSLAIGYPF